MAFDCTVVRAKLVVSDRISSTLDDNCVWTESKPDLLHDRVVDVEERVIVDALLQRHVEGVVLTFGCSSFFQISCAWEEVAISMEGDRHDAISCIEGLFYAVSMVHVDVYVQYPVVVFEELKDC